jgi:peptidoglycan hydrolase-like protein with peptidoglycan-binding domain
LGKSRKAKVKGIVDDGLKPSTLVAGALSTGLTGMVLFNLFLGQHGPMKPPDGATTRVSVEAPGKTSQTVTLKYDELTEDVQRELLALGHFNGMVDGVSGPMTRDAVIRYQRNQQLEETGAVSKQLLEHILYTRKISQAAEFTGSVKAVVKPVPEEMVVEDLAALSAKKRKVATKAEPAERIVDAETDSQVLSLQKRLARLGFDPGTRSGKLDEKTKAAILTFEMEHGMAMEGKLSKTFLAALEDAEKRAGLAD